MPGDFSLFPFRGFRNNDVAKLRIFFQKMRRNPDKILFIQFIIGTRFR